MAEAGMKAEAVCPACGCERLFGPSDIVTPDGVNHRYFSCPCCHSLVLEDVETGRLVARAAAW